jgi:poly-gamma-glutamate capsule biosynthesis protein CapA/YwtB (metallophosphatase superfamily)
MGSPYPLHYTLRWPFYYMWPSTKNHSKMQIKPLEHQFIQTDDDAYLRLHFCGDIMLTQHDTVPWLHPDVRSIINSADLFIGNCEAPVGKHAINPSAKYHLIYHMPKLFLTGIMRQLTLSAKQWVLSVANNHAGDKGKEAYFASLNVLNDMGITVVGHVDHAQLPLTVIEHSGLKVGIVAWTAWMNREVFHDQQGAARLKHIEKVHWEAVKTTHQLDILIGLPHWEYEFQHYPQQKTRSLAKALIDTSGFNLLVGAHPHTLQPMEWFSNGICAYSLGNFCGLGLAWPVRLIPILEVKLGIKNEHKGRMLGYKLHYFVQVNHAGSMKILPLSEVSSSLRKKLLMRLEKVFHP